MLMISKQDALKLVEMGVNWGTNGISATKSCHGKNRTYYLCTSKPNMKKYREIQKSKKITKG